MQFSIISILRSKSGFTLYYKTYLFIYFLLWQVYHLMQNIEIYNIFYKHQQFSWKKKLIVSDGWVSNVLLPPLNIGRCCRGEYIEKMHLEASRSRFSPRQTLTSTTQPHTNLHPFERQAATCQKFVFYFAQLPLFLSLFWGRRVIGISGSLIWSKNPDGTDI